MKVDMCRVYFNRKEDLTKLWSVDFGDGTVECQCRFVAIRVRSFTNYNLEQTHPNKPEVWLQIMGPVDVQLESNGQITISDLPE